MSPADLYWLALNLLPYPLIQVRSLHFHLRSGEELARCGAEEMAEVLRHAVHAALPSRGPGAGAATAAATSAPWWSRVISGGLGYASPLEVDCGVAIPSGACLLDAAEAELRRATSLGIRPITLGDPRYPPLLASTSAPPPVLYVVGQVEELFTASEACPCPPTGWWSAEPTAAAAGFSPSPLPAASRVFLAVVGSRRPTDYGRAVSRRLGRALARSGAAVLSGLARGIDTEAHLGALEGPGATVAVLAGGLAAPMFPRENSSLARRIAQSGALLSEFPLDTHALRSHFPRRNRIIAGLSAGVAVVEAAAQSGALITARLALEEGRDVFAVPGRITDPSATGSNGLLRAGSAAPLTREEDMVEDLAPIWRNLLSRSPALAQGRRVPLSSDLNPTEKPLMELLRPDEAADVDFLVSRSGQPVGEVLAALIALEIGDSSVPSPADGISSLPEVCRAQNAADQFV